MHPGQKIHHRKPAAYIAEAQSVLRFQQYFCISHIGRFSRILFANRAFRRKRPYFEGALWAYGVFFGRFAQIFGELLTTPLKSAIVSQALIVLNSTW